MNLYIDIKYNIDNGTATLKTNAKVNDTIINISDFSDFKNKLNESLDIIENSINNGNLNDPGCLYCSNACFKRIKNYKLKPGKTKSKGGYKKNPNNYIKAPDIIRIRCNKYRIGKSFEDITLALKFKCFNKCIEDNYKEFALNKD